MEKKNHHVYKDILVDQEYLKVYKLYLKISISRYYKN